MNKFSSNDGTPFLWATYTTSEIKHAASASTPGGLTWAIGSFNGPVNLNGAHPPLYMDWPWGDYAAKSRLIRAVRAAVLTDST